MFRLLAPAIAASAFLLAACSDEQATPYLEFIGGGFVFNYRNAELYYGFVARPKKPLPEGARLEAEFEVPIGPPLVISEPVRPGQLQYMFRTGHLRGIVKNHPYRAVLRLIDTKTGAEIARYEKTFATEVDQSTLPDRPLVVGPGYQQPE
jgi:hypothetical protein